MKTVSIAVVGILLCGTIGCDSDCAGLPIERVIPNEATIAVGGRLTPRFETGGYCAGEAITIADVQTRETRWSTKDTLVVSVDSLTGVVIGRAVGDARISASAVNGAMLIVHVR